jgi:antitoxin HicB
MIRYQAKLHKEKDGYWVEFPDLPGCFTQGESLGETLKNAQEALSLWLEGERTSSWDVPAVKERRGKNYYWIAPTEDVSVPLMIRQARKKRGLTQAELAKKIGITTQQLQKLETPGKSNPTVKTLAAISEALDEHLTITIAS